MLWRAATAASCCLAIATVGRAQEECSEVDTSAAVLSASHDNTVNVNEDYSRALDSDMTTKWLVYEAVDEPVWLQVVLPTATAVTKYGITSANDAPERDPSAWSLSASNDGVYFVTLDVQIGALWDERDQRQVFSLDNTVEYSYYRWDFNSVRDMDTANSMQINYISLYEGDCEDPCCGVDCGDNGSCSDGDCVCDTGYEGSTCQDMTEEWGLYEGRSIGGMTASTSTTTTDLTECEAVCIEGNSDAPCIGVTFDATSGTCDVFTGAGGSWTLAVAADGTDSTAALLLSANLLDPADPSSKEVEEQVAYTVDWNPTNHQMPRVDMYIGETLTFEWEDTNVRNLPQYSDPNHHDIYLFAGEQQYQRCDFRGASVVAVAPRNEANERVTWTSTTEGKFYFGSKYGTDCSVGQLKMIVQVTRRPTP